MSASIEVDDLRHSNHLNQQGEDDLSFVIANEPIDLSIDEVRDILASCAAEGCGYQEWIEVGMAIHHHFRGGVDGLELFDGWSKQDSRRYVEGEPQRKWRSFNQQHNPITLRTVINRVKWKRNIGEAKFEAPQRFQPWEYVDPYSLMPPQFVYGDFYAKGYLSMTVAWPKVGKSQLSLFEAVDAALGGVLCSKDMSKRKVLYYCAEDDLNAIQARVIAICQHYGVDQRELEGFLYVVSGIDRTDMLLMRGKDAGINDELFAWLEDFIIEAEIEIVILDPLQDMTTSEETNEVFRKLGQRLRVFAVKCGCAVHLVHHTRKVAPGAQAGIDDARGGSAIRGVCRFNRVLTPMTDSEATAAGIEDRWRYFKVAEAESNHAPPSADMFQWFVKVSVQVNPMVNSPALERWTYPTNPNAFGEAERRTAVKVIREAEETSIGARKSERTKDWVGHAIGETLGINTAEKEGKKRVVALLNLLAADGYIEAAQQKDANSALRPVWITCDPLADEDCGEDLI